MNRLAIPLSIFAVAALTACGSPPYAPAQANAAPIVPQTTGYRPGTGVVVSTTVAPAPMGSASGGTATGASSNSAGRLARLAIRMDDGTVQYVDTDGNEFKPGTRVELTPDGLIRKL